MVSALNAGTPPALLAAAFHRALAAAVAEAVQLVAGPIRLVGLTGGGRMNNYLSSGPRFAEGEVIERIKSFRRRRPRLLDDHVTLAHGTGGKASAARCACTTTSRSSTPNCVS